MHEVLELLEEQLVPNVLRRDIEPLLREM